MSSKKQLAGVTKAKKRTSRARAAGKANPAGQVRVVSVDTRGIPKVHYDQETSLIKGGKMVKVQLDKVTPSIKRAVNSLTDRADGIDVVVVQRGGLEEDWPGRGDKKAFHYTVKVGGPSHGRPALDTSVLIERMLPDAPVPTPAQALQAQRNSEARWELLREFGAHTSEEIAARRSRAKNRHALANRWRSEGKVFAVDFKGQQIYPGFQFDHETFAPNPLVAEVLAALPREEMSDWEVALWWTAGNGWLDGARPVDLMQEGAEAVVAAAAHEAEPSPF